MTLWLPGSSRYGVAVVTGITCVTVMMPVVITSTLETVLVSMVMKQVRWEPWCYLEVTTTLLLPARRSTQPRKSCHLSDGA